MRARDRAVVQAGINRFLSAEPTRLSQSRIKVLVGFSSPRYRLRIDNFRVFYDVIGDEVYVLAVRPKPEAAGWLLEFGVRE